MNTGNGNSLMAINAIVPKQESQDYVSMYKYKALLLVNCGKNYNQHWHSHPRNAPCLWDVFHIGCFLGRSFQFARAHFIIL